MNEFKDYKLILNILERKVSEFNKKPSLDKYKSVNNTIREINHYLIEDVIESHAHDGRGMK